MVLNSFDLKGKVAVITGGAGLYGKQIVTSLAEANATVYFASRGIEKNAELAEELSKRGLKVYSKRLDLGDEKSINSLCDEIYEKEGRADILVNNAVLRSMNGYTTGTAEEFDKSMHVNATGLFLISRAFGDKMKEMGCGSIINIGSYMGIFGPNYDLYERTGMCENGASPDYFFHKGGITNYTRYLASHYGKFNIRCNCLELGGLFNHQNELFLDKYCRSTCLGRMANDTDLKGIIVFLASDASAYITGAIIPVDGGYSAK